MMHGGYLQQSLSSLVRPLYLFSLFLILVYAVAANNCNHQVEIQSLLLMTVPLLSG